MLKLMLTKETFEKGLHYLGSTFGTFHAVHSFEDKSISDFWYGFICHRYSDERFLELVVYYCANAEKHPKNFEQVRRFWDENNPPPGEGAIASDHLLESEQAKMDEDQRLVNLRRIRVLTEALVASVGMPGRESLVSHVLDAPGEDLKDIGRVFEKAPSVNVLKCCYEENGVMKLPPDLTLAEARHLLEVAIEGVRGGSKRMGLLHAAVVAWGNNPANGCELILDENGAIVDLDVRF